MTYHRKIAKCRLYTWSLLICVCLPFIFAYSVSDKKHINIHPANYIFVPHNVTKEIFCTGSGKDYSAENLVFTRSGTLVSSELYNDTTIVLREGQTKHPMYTYFCQNKKRVFKDKANVNVTVGDPPGYVMDFKCISYNMEILNCSWTTPDLPFQTIYSLTFFYQGNAVKPCVAESVDVSLTRYCFWLKYPDKIKYPNNVNPQYRIHYTKYNFSLTSTYKSSTKTQQFIFDHFSIVKPNRPVNLSINNISTNSVKLNWDIPKNVMSLDMEHKIEYQIRKNVDYTYFRSVNTKVLRGRHKSYTFNLTLEYPYMEYLVRISIKPYAATGEEFWSDFSYFEVFKTACGRPQKPPAIAAGGFYQITTRTHRNLDVYWKPIEEYEESGANFSYKCKVNQDSETLTNITEGHLYIENASLSAIEISFWSSNEIGRSVNTSHLYIPPEKETQSLQVKAFTKFSYGNGTYELLWRGVPDISNYTLFWCKGSKNCKYPIDFKVMEPSRTNYVIDLPSRHNHFFAISANKYTLSSGMTLIKECDFTTHVVENNYDFPLTYEYEANETFVKLKWTTDCSFRKGIIMHYGLAYCKVSKEGSCSNSTTLNTKHNFVSIMQLEPFTYYKFTMMLYTSFGLRHSKSSVTVKTLEASPTAPRNFNKSYVQSNSVNLSWSPPLQVNGDINNIEYEIYNFDKIILVSKKQQVVLKDLLAFTNYSLTVRACNVNHKCSNFTNAVFVTTKIERPGKPTFSFKNNELLIVAEFSTEYLLRYEINVTTDEPSKIINITNVNNIKVVKVSSKLCTGTASKEVYLVRALNFDKHNDSITIPGDWSDEITINCKTDTITLILIVFLILIVIGSFLTCICWYIYWIQNPAKNKNVDEMRKGYQGIHEIRPESCSKSPNAGPSITRSTISESESAHSQHTTGYNNINNPESSSEDDEEEQKELARSVVTPLIQRNTGVENVMTMVQQARNGHIPTLLQNTKSANTMDSNNTCSATRSNTASINVEPRLQTPCDEVISKTPSFKPIPEKLKNAMLA